MYDYSIAGAYAGRPAYDLYLYVRRHQTDAANNRSSYAFELRARNPSRSRLTFALDRFPWSINIGGQIVNGTASLDFRGGQEYLTLFSGTTGWYSHDAAGNLTIVVDAYHNAGSPFGTADPDFRYFPTDRIPKPPGQPFAVSFDRATTNSLRFIFSGTTDGGSPILEWQAQADDDPNFGSPNSTWSAGDTTFTNLSPATQYRARARGRNAYGWGPWSAVDSNAIATTMTASPPSLAVAPSITGASAVLTLAPPSNVSSVNSFRVERRVVGTTTVTTLNTATSPVTVSSLVPGTVYQWRASAFIGSYQTPWTEWQTVAQPKPNTNPGDYFDGSTPARADITYIWVGAAGASQSRAVGLGVAGWGVDSYDNGGAAVLHRITGGQTQRYSARVLVVSDATGAGIRAGQTKGSTFASDVTEGGLYRAYISVRPVRAQRGAAEISWWTSGNALISREVVSTPAIYPAGAWRQITGTGIAPVGAARATVNFIDVAGTGHSPWLSTEYFDLDSAFTTLGAEAVGYFDGNTADTEQFQYSWMGAENASVSQRLSVFTEMANPLADPDCDPIPGAPQPPAIANACIDEVGTWRRYWAIIPESEVYDWLTVVPTIAITTGGFAARQVRIRFYENPDGLAPEDADGTPMQSEQIISFMPKNTTVTIDAVSESAWASVDGADPIPAEELLYGTGGGPATWPELTCGSAYLISFDVPLDAPIGNLSIGVSLTTRMS